MTTESVGGRFHRFGVGDRLRAARETAGLSQDELAALTGISRQTISNYEQGVSKRPKSIYVRALAAACGFDPDWAEHGIEPENDPDGGGILDSRGQLDGATPEYDHLPVSRLFRLPAELVACAQSAAASVPNRPHRAPLARAA